MNFKMLNIGKKVSNKTNINVGFQIETHQPILCKNESVSGVIQWPLELNLYLLNYLILTEVLKSFP